MLGHRGLTAAQTLTARAGPRLMLESRPMYGKWLQDWLP
jgi:hypothetical protein